MKKLIFILLLFIPALLNATTYYVSSTGVNDAGRDGSIEEPWATLSYACTREILPYDVIIIQGSITDNNRAVLPVRSNLSGIGNATITTSYVATSTSDAYLRLYSSVLADGNQTISNITFNGNNLTATRAIWVGYRYNVKIQNCRIQNFLYAGIHFRNQISWVSPPAVYATGNEVSGCTFTNCSHMHTGEPAQLRLDGQSGFLIYNNIFDQRQRTASNNGAHVRWSNVQKIKMHHNTFYHNDNEVTTAGDWAFFGELWHNKGDCEIYENTFYGHSTLDIAGFDNEIIAGNTFSYKIYNNRFLNTVKVDPVLVGVNDYSHQYAITIEGTDHEYMYVYNNLFQRYGYGIEIATGSSTESGIPARNFLHDHFYIYTNIFEDMGYATYNISAAIMVINEVNDPGYTNTSTNWWIVNNVMTGGNRAQRGFKTTWIGTITNINFKNNIVYDFTNYAVYHDHRTGDVTNLTNSSFTYNDFYSNGSGTTYDAVYIHGSITQSGNNITTGNITSNPLFVSSTDFHLQSNSPAISAGTPVDVTRDYDDNYFASPPSIGAFEALVPPISLTTNIITSIEATTATTGGNITSDGGFTITQRGVAYSTSTSPTIAGDYTSNGVGTGVYTSLLKFLTPGTTYYVRAYAINSQGTVYGNERSFITEDVDPGVEINGPILRHDGKILKYNGKILRK
jgi:hypothetical protein